GARRYLALRDRFLVRLPRARRRDQPPSAPRRVDPTLQRRQTGCLRVRERGPPRLERLQPSRLLHPRLVLTTGRAREHRAQPSGASIRLRRAGIEVSVFRGAAPGGCRTPPWRPTPVLGGVLGPVVPACNGAPPCPMPGPARLRFAMGGSNAFPCPHASAHWWSHQPHGVDLHLDFERRLT